MTDPLMLSLFVFAIALVGCGWAFALWYRAEQVDLRLRSRPLCLWCDHPEHINTCVVIDPLDNVTCGCDPSAGLHKSLVLLSAPARSGATLPLEEAARDVWHAWRIAMQAQHRIVAPEQRSWELLPERERDLDRHIARILAARWSVRIEEEAS